MSDENPGEREIKYDFTENPKTRCFLKNDSWLSSMAESAVNSAMVGGLYDRTLYAGIDPIKTCCGIFYQHRGSRDDALRTAKYYGNEEELKKLMIQYLYYLGFRKCCGVFRFKEIHPDDEFYDHIVILNDQAIGYTRKVGDLGPLERPYVPSEIILGERGE